MAVRLTKKKSGSKVKVDLNETEKNKLLTELIKWTVPITLLSVVFAFPTFFELFFNLANECWLVRYALFGGCTIYFVCFLIYILKSNNEKSFKKECLVFVSTVFAMGLLASFTGLTIWSALGQYNEVRNSSNFTITVDSSNTTNIQGPIYEFDVGRNSVLVEFEIKPRENSSVNYFHFSFPEYLRVIDIQILNHSEQRLSSPRDYEPDEKLEADRSELFISFNESIKNSSRVKILLNGTILPEGEFIIETEARRVFGRNRVVAEFILGERYTCENECFFPGSNVEFTRAGKTHQVRIPDKFYLDEDRAQPVYQIFHVDTNDLVKEKTAQINDGLFISFLVAFIGSLLECLRQMILLFVDLVGKKKTKNF